MNINSNTEVRWALAIHGGAGGIPRGTAEQLAALRQGLAKALETGADLLRAGGDAVDAVQASVQWMEQCGLFNAGRGAVLNSEGFAELDAAIMRGRDRAAGAVAAVRRVPSPVALARAVMDDGRHVLLVGEGAEQFAVHRGITLVEPGYFITGRRREELQKVKAAAGDDGDAVPPWYSLGTVGAVALDLQGGLAAATSTGGLTNKAVGRVGDSPLIGAGTYAQNGVCAVSATGHGEFFIRFAAAHSVCARIRYGGEDCEQAAAVVIRELAACGGLGGLIAVDAGGVVSMPFATPAMLRGCVGRDLSARVWLGVESLG